MATGESAHESKTSNHKTEEMKFLLLLLLTAFVISAIVIINNMIEDKFQ